MYTVIALRHSNYGMKHSAFCWWSMFAGCV